MAIGRCRSQSIVTMSESLRRWSEGRFERGKGILVRALGAGWTEGWGQWSGLANGRRGTVKAGRIERWDPEGCGERKVCPGKGRGEPQVEARWGGAL